MAGLFFYFEGSREDVFSGRHRDLDAWNYAAKMGGIDKFAICNLSDLPDTSPDQDVPTRFVSGPEELSGIKVYICPRGDRPVSDIEHETVDWYCFGPASGWPEPQHTGFHVPGGIDLHAVHAATAVMYERIR